MGLLNWSGLRRRRPSDGATFVNGCSPHKTQEPRKGESRRWLISHGLDECSRRESREAFPTAPEIDSSLPTTLAGASLEKNVTQIKCSQLRPSHWLKAAISYLLLITMTPRRLVLGIGREIILIEDNIQF